MLNEKIPAWLKGTFPQFIAVFTGTLMATSDGMQYGWSAPVTPILLSEESPIKVTKAQTEWLESILLLGALCGLPVTVFLVDRIGRKNCILLSTVTTLVVWIVLAVADKIEYVFIVRFLTGMAGDMAFVAAPMYIAEIADQRVRGFLSSLVYLMMLIGIILVYSIAPFVPFYVTSIIGGGLLVVELLTFPFMPESPYYLLYKNRPEEAKQALRYLRQSDDVDKELGEITAAVKRQITEGGKFKDIILVKSNRKALIIMTVLNGAQHMSSITVILMNLHSILESAGSFYIKASSAAIIFSVIMFIAAITASVLIDKYGRKILLTTSSILAGLCVLSIAIFFSLKNSGVDVLNFSWMPVVSVMLYAATFKLGLGMVPIVVTAELFPTKMKAIGMTIADGMYVGFAVISLQVYHFLSHAFGIHVPFFIFSGCCFFTAVFTLFFIPETKGKTLDEIQFILKGEAYPSNPKVDAETIS